jgi:hypothetical protein
VPKEKQIFYIIYRRKRAIVVSKEEWEKSWLDWYLKDK